MNNKHLSGGGYYQKPYKIRNKRLLIISLCLVLVSFLLIGGTFSYLYLTTEGENTNVVMGGCLKISLNETKGLTLNNEVPMSDKEGRTKEPYNITITNTCNTDAYFKTTLNVLDTSNRENISKTRLAVSRDRTINTLLISDLMKAKLNNTPSNITDTYLIDRGYLNQGESKTYDIKLWIDYDATSYEGSLDTKVIVDSYVKGQEPIHLQSNLTNAWKDKTENEFNYLALYTLDTKELPSTYSYNNEVYTLNNTIDVSEQNNGEVLLGEYTLGDKVIAVLGQEGGVIAPTSCFSLFSGYTNAVAKFELIDLSNFDTSKVTDMYGMFYQCVMLDDLQLNYFDTKNVTNMGLMFVENKLVSIDLSSFDTSKVTSFQSMFLSCRSLESINISKFTNNTTANLVDMFSNCNSLKTVDMRNISVSSQTKVSGMFYGNSSLEKVIVGCNYLIDLNSKMVKVC